MSGTRFMLAAAFFALGFASGCCSWCDRNCPPHAAVAPVAYAAPAPCYAPAAAPACCPQPAACCPPASGYAPQPAPQWNRP